MCLVVAPRCTAEKEAKRAEREKVAAELKARRRMLGNIIFVGQLYRQGVLTEAVMHSCIKQLLEEVRMVGAARPDLKDAGRRQKGVAGTSMLLPSVRCAIFAD